jgi:hypothetical protein
VVRQRERMTDADWSAVNAGAVGFTTIAMKVLFIWPIMVAFWILTAAAMVTLSACTMAYDLIVWAVASRTFPIPL